MTNWQTKKLGDVLEKIEGGGTPSKEKKEFWNGSIPWASVKDLTSFNPKETQDYITDEGLKNSSSRLIKAGTLITPTRMALGFTVRFDVDVAINQDLKALYPIDDMNTEYIQYWFEAYRKTIERLGTGSTVAGIQVGELRALKIQVPEKPEQERIAGVLEVWDEYIEKLEQKIALKEQLKKGLMQQLLTGKRRLPGFKKDWQTVKLGNISRIKTGGKDNQNKITDGMYPFFVRSPQIERINSYCFDGEAILVPGEGNIGKIFHYINGKFDYHQRVYGITHFTDNVSGRYIYYFFVKNFARQAEKHSVKATVDSLRLPTFSNFIINLPSLDEQVAIVKVLDGLAEEVKLSENKLKKINEQKKYLLKNLITGTIRTPEDLQPLDTSRLERSAL